jgi:hypothetical protein
MSSPPSTKPYKSRLFNFLNRQYINLNSQISLRLRQIGYLISIGIKTLIYPLHLLTRNNKTVNHNLSSSPQNKSQYCALNPDAFATNLPLPHCDQLIVDVDHLLNTHDTIKQLNPSQYQGLACNLINHKLVFVNHHNKIHDILSPQQQLELSVIIREIRGDYWQKNRIKKIREDNQLKNQSIGQWALSQWQIIKYNLQQLKISSLTVTKDSENQENITDRQQHNYSSINSNDKLPKILLFFDQNIAKLENISLFNLPTLKRELPLEIKNNKLNLKDELGQKEQREIGTNDKGKLSLFILIKLAIEYFFGSHKKNNNLPKNDSNKGNNSENLIEPNQQQLAVNSSKLKQVKQQKQRLIEKLSQKTKKLIPIIVNTTEQLVNQGLNQITSMPKKLVNRNCLSHQDNPFQIQILIWAAIDYFLKSKNRQNSLSSPTNKLPNLPFITHEELIVVNNEITDPWLSWADLFGEENPELELRLPSKKNNSLQTINQANSEIKKQNCQNNSETQADIANIKNSVTLTYLTEKVIENEVADEIEAKVIEIKYEKHLLEIILEKLDSIMLWLEEFLIKLWQRLNLLIKGKKQAK